MGVLVPDKTTKKGHPRPGKTTKRGVLAPSKTTKKGGVLDPGKTTKKGGLAPLEILHLKARFLTICIHLRPLITADLSGFIDDPRAYVFGIVPDLEDAEAVAAMEHPFTDIADAFRDFDICQGGTFIEGVLSYLQQEAVVCKIHLS